MALPTSYMTGNYTKIPQYFEAILNAQAPEKFTVKFIKDLGFTSSTDIQFISVLKSLGFLDDSGVPTEDYYQLYDRTKTKQLIAEGIRRSYSDLFALNMNAQSMSRDELKGKFKTLTAGQKTDSTINQMVSTFMNLCNYADWTTPAPVGGKQDEHENNHESERKADEKKDQTPFLSSRTLDLNYDIHIHLPATRDQAVYDALFASLAKHLPLQ